nr:EOG090X01FO [Eulimnadia texana]
MLASLYNGNVHIWNFESQQLIKSFEVCDLPVRAAKFVPRKNWVITGSDDMQVRVFNYNTLDRVTAFEAHSDYVRCIAVHPTQPFILTSSDDMTIKLWNWEKQWACQQVFEGHTHYVMQIVINPKDNNTFASASLDRTVKVWQLGSSTPNFTLEGHDKGVNCVDYYHAGDKPYLISGADDRMVKIWDYQNKTCVQTLEGHAQNIAAVAFHPELPIILTGSEDGTVRVWHSNTYRLETTLNYGLERVWTICCLPGSNNIALGYDEGSIMIKLGREEPAMSMDQSGKIIWAKHSEIQQANLKALSDSEIKDGEPLPLAIKDMGACEIYPQSIAHNPNGSSATTLPGTRTTPPPPPTPPTTTTPTNTPTSPPPTTLTTTTTTNTTSFAGIFGGYMLGIKSINSLSFYDWDNLTLIRRIEIQPRGVYWSDSGELVCISTEDSFYILRYSADAVANALETKEGVSEDGVDDAFEVLNEVQESVRAGIWVGDCFIYTNSVNRLNYYVGGEIVTIAHLDRVMYLLGYIPKENSLYLGDKELNVVSYRLQLSVLEYQTAVMRRDFESAGRVLPSIPKEHRTRVAHFLEKQGFKQQALAVSTDPEHRFELALQLGELDLAHQLAIEAQSEHKWRQLADIATSKCNFELAQECLHKANDFGGLLLLATASGNADMVQRLGDAAETAGTNNVAFLARFLSGDLNGCLQVLMSTNRFPEAAFFARTYLPSQISRVVQLWKENLARVNAKASQSLADPVQYENLFPGLMDALKTEQFLKQHQQQTRLPAQAYRHIPANHERSPVQEMLQAEESGKFRYVPVTDAEDAHFQDALEQVPDEKADKYPPSTLLVDFEEPAIQQAPVAKAPPPSAPTPASLSVAQLEKELELDLENLELDDNVDTSDVVLDDDLLAD